MKIAGEDEDDVFETFTGSKIVRIQVLKSVVGFELDNSNMDAWEVHLSSRNSKKLVIDETGEGDTVFDSFGFEFWLWFRAILPAKAAVRSKMVSDGIVAPDGGIYLYPIAVRHGKKMIVLCRGRVTATPNEEWNILIDLPSF